MDYSGSENGTRTNAEQSETPADFRVSYESRDAWERARASYLREQRERREALNADCHLYFIQIVGGRKPVKIGKAKNPIARLSQIQISCPYELALRGTLNGCGHWESIFHNYLARDRMRGEWFRWSCEVESLVKLAIAGDDWKTVLEPQRDNLDAIWWEGSPLYASARA